MYYERFFNVRDKKQEDAYYLILDIIRKEDEEIKICWLDVTLAQIRTEPIYKFLFNDVEASVPLHLIASLENKCDTKSCLSQEH